MPDPAPDGLAEFRAAALMDKFHLMPAGLADLTDRQIQSLCFHPRTKDGGLKPPELPEPPAAPVTDATRLRGIDALLAMNLINPQNATDLREQVKRRNEPGSDS